MSQHIKATKKETIAHFKAMLASNAAWAQRGLLAIYQRQTPSEQNSQATLEDNGVGFTGADAEFLTSLAQALTKWGKLSEKQMAHLYKKMPKYAGQLLRISNGEV